MKFKQLKCEDLEMKVMGDTGTFSGHASIFGNVDLGGDVVERGAFKEFVLTKDGMIRVLLQHDTRHAIGKAKVFEDEKGLGFEGMLVMENADARGAHALMKQGILDGMSIGYDTLADRFDEASGTRFLTSIKLWEISPVVFGMNPLARIDTVKDVMRARKVVSTIRELEDLLRDECGFSNAQAKAVAVGGWKALQGARDEPSGDAEAVNSFLKFLQDPFKETSQ